MLNLLSGDGNGLPPPAQIQSIMDERADLPLAIKFDTADLKTHMANWTKSHATAAEAQSLLEQASQRQTALADKLSAFAHRARLHDAFSHSLDEVHLVDAEVQDMPSQRQLIWMSDGERERFEQLTKQLGELVSMGSQRIPRDRIGTETPRQVEVELALVREKVSGLEKEVEKISAVENA